MYNYNFNLSKNKKVYFLSSKKIKMATYQSCLNDAMRLHRVDTPTEKCKHLAVSVYKMKQRYREHEEKKKNKSIVILTETPKEKPITKHSGDICQAITMKGKKCTFKAACGGFCKKHSKCATSVALGEKPSF